MHIEITPIAFKDYFSFSVVAAYMVQEAQAARGGRSTL